MTQSTLETGHGDESAKIVKETVAAARGQRNGEAWGRDPGLSRYCVLD